MEEQRKKTRFEEEIDEMQKEFAENLVETFRDRGHYCTVCGMRTHMCFCGASRNLTRRDYR